MKKKIYDSEETLKAGLKAEQDTVVEYTKYLNLAKQNENLAEVKLWEHIIADEKEHIKEFENALKGDFKLLDEDGIVITERSEEWIKKHKEKVENFMDDIVDVLADNEINRNDYILDHDDPWYYVDFGSDKKVCEKAYEALRDNFYECHFVDDDGFYYVKIKRR